MAVIRTKLVGWSALVAVALAIGVVPCSLAQEIAPTGEYQEGLTLGSWMLYPKVFLGAVYDDNFSQLNQDNSGWSARAVPNISGVYDGGIHKSTVYGVMDARFFDATNLSATAGFSHVYEAMRDLVFTFQGNYTRQTDLFTSALNFNNGAIGPNTTASPDANIPIVLNPFGTTPSVDPAAYNQFTGSAAVTKTFDNVTFLTLRGTAFHIAFDDKTLPPDPFATSHDGTSYWLSARAGYNILPSAYLFAEGTAVLQRFHNSIFDTNGYRVVGGAGTNDPQSLFRGEVYGGFQAQSNVHHNINELAAALAPEIPVNLIGLGIPTDADSAVFGGRLYYYPTRYLTFVGIVDQVLGTSTQASASTPAGTPSLSTNAILQVNYSLSRSWTLGSRIGLTESRYYGLGRTDKGRLLGASFSYEIWRNLSLTLDYQYTTVLSKTPGSNFSDILGLGFFNLPGSSFSRNVYTAGLTYKY
jgi:hypothetical protein